VVEKLKNFQDYFDVLIANPKSFKKGKRFIDVDLNRSYPGNLYSSKYEERLAYKNFEIVRKYKYVIDIHEASQGKDDFIIIPRNFLGKSFPVEWIDLEKILFWPFPQGPISQFLENSIELEFGMKDVSRNVAVKKAIKIVERFIESFKNFEGKVQNTKKKEKYYVYGKEKIDNVKNINKYRDFKKTFLNKEHFYPLLVGQYIENGIAFYKMKKINEKQNVLYE
jgi:hypothetical protein